MDFKRLCFILGLLFLLAGTSAAQSHKTMPDSVSLARIIHITGDRIYFDRGKLNGLDNSWQILWPVSESDSTLVPPSWIGDDLSYFIRPDSVFHYYTIMETIGLRKIPSKARQWSKITLAWPRMPSLPHQDRRDLYDREFCSYLCDVLRYEPVTHMVRGPADGPNPFSKAIKFSDGRIIANNQPYYTFIYFSKRLSSFNYLLKFMPDVYHKGHWQGTIHDSMSLPRYQFLLNGTNIPILKATPLQDNPGDTTIEAKRITDNYEIDTTCTVTSGFYYITEKNAHEITLIKNEFVFPDKTFPDTIIIKIEPDYLKRKLMFQLGEIDFLDLNFADIDQFKTDHVIKESVMPEAAWLSVNNLKNFLSDGVLTTALSYLINKESLCRVALGNSARPLDGIIPQWSDDITSIYGFDRNKGKALIKNMGTVPRYLSLYISPDDFWNRRTAEYIKGILERENIYVTIYSELLSGEGRPYDLFQQFDMMLGRVDITRTNPLYILNQLTFHYDFSEITSNRSLFYSPEYDSVITSYLKGIPENDKIIKEYYRDLSEIPSGICLFQPVRQVVASRRIKNFELNDEGLINFRSIEIIDETQR